MDMAMRGDEGERGSGAPGDIPIEFYHLTKEKRPNEVVFQVGF
jgi:hypothetical protein